MTDYLYSMCEECNQEWQNGFIVGIKKFDKDKYGNIRYGCIHKENTARLTKND